MAIPCPAAEACSQAAQPEQRSGPAGVTALGAAHLRFGRVAMFNVGWQGWFGATSETKAQHKENPANPHPTGTNIVGNKGRWSFKGRFPSPSDTASKPG